MLTYSVPLGSETILDKTGVIDKTIMPAVNQAVRAIAKATAAEWQQTVYRAKLWSGEKDAYAESITWRMTGDFSAVVSSDYKYVQDIETGRPARDLKKMLDTSLKVRRTEGGKRFLVIPMRHNTPGNGALAKSMPASVYNMAKQLAASRVVATGQRPSGEVTHLSPKSGMHASAQQTPYLSNPKTRQASTVASRKYAWGGRLTPGMLKGAGLDAATAKRYAGMVKMDTSTPGGAKSSAYMTFRIMMEGQKGWVIPPQPGMFLAKKTVETMQPNASEAMKLAIQKSLKP